MGVFLRHTAKAFALDRCISFLDQAGWHVAEALRLPRGMKRVRLPARGPELNPTESLWKPIRARYLGPGPLESLQAVEDGLCAAFHALDQPPERVKSLCGYRWLKTILLTENQHSLCVLRQRVDRARGGSCCHATASFNRRPSLTTVPRQKHSS